MLRYLVIGAEFGFTIFVAMVTTYFSGIGDDSGVGMYPEVGADGPGIDFGSEIGAAGPSIGTGPGIGVVGPGIDTGPVVGSFPF